jgi:LPXTG-site transpeptidase (sortase) family protein
MKQDPTNCIIDPGRLRGCLVFGIGVLVLLVAICHVLLPALERQATLNEQSRILENIRLGDGTVILDSQVVSGIGILTIDKINLELPVIDGVDNMQQKVVVGCTPQTVPIGAVGNAVIVGQRSNQYGQLFNRLGELEIGDTINYHPKDSDWMLFQIVDIHTIRPDEQIAQTEDVYELTLYACTPEQDDNPALLIRAKRIMWMPMN